MRKQCLLNQVTATLITTLCYLLLSPVTYAQNSPDGLTPGALAVASAHPLATQAGVDVMNQGGNAFDAAIAVTAVLAVVEPYSSGLGGGGFYLLKKAQSERAIMLDARERAPLAAERNMYLDEAGEVAPNLSVDGALAAGIPGIPAALAQLADHYGALPLTVSLQPAIILARDGFPVDEVYRRLAKFRLAALRASPAARAVMLADGEVPEAGYKLKQTDLAATLEALAKSGVNGFYAGAVADKLVAGTRAAGGIWTHDDLRQYTVVERTPIQSQYHGMQVVSVAPPSSGGVALGEILSILAGYGDLANYSPADRHHFIVEAMRRAYRDRAQYLGDSDFVDVPIVRLINPFYGEGLRATIHPQKATPSSVLPGVSDTGKGTDTTHFSIIDKQGNQVSATLSVNYPFGSGYMPEGTGILLNNEMDDFSAKPGVPNLYGLVGAEANAIAPGKRMLSSMSPTFLQKDGRIAIVGTPGGSRIITMVLLAALEFHAGGDAQSMVSLPRFHHQYLPDTIFYEPNALSPALIQGLQAKGHTLKQGNRTWGNMHTVIWDTNTKQVTAASDPRGIGSAVVAR